MKHLVLILILALTGCSSVRHAVITSTGTGLGFSITENPSTGLYEVKFGYIRSEFAFVPSNRSGLAGETNFNNGAKDVADVMMELRFENLLKGGGLYQRLAVGSVAVSQPGAAFMFAKGSDGNLDPSAAKAIAEAARSIPTANAEAVDGKVPLAEAYQKAANQDVWDAVAQLRGHESFAAWLSDPKTTTEQVAAMATSLKQANLMP